ncbi:Adenosine kinase [Kitasatospora sp. MMS16-BH015]|uniref:carbohydrate kinase family protein n=1 Tax=Kitasatospora sp. MMS16-BH015 TaxID=2018025 RepID=UPI000CA1A347|nr:carbohydrate kinase family protein [Kitasatospora sp. MMS16-BH015]AUG78944.1 Adenosine kinase [Kitasatospora sp. MMS16-BH015]
MRIAVTGSIATDHLMVYPGRFADQLIEGRLDKVSLSFLADDLEVRRGGVAANIAFGLGSLGLRPVLVGAAGRDFAEYRVWLEAAGVDTESVRISDSRHTARFVCTTDADQNQIATFYAGAMSEARELTLAPIAERVGGLDLVVIAPNDPEAMIRHTDECRALGLSFAADPSQQLARLDRAEVRRLVEGADLLFTNEYEAALLQQRSGWTEHQVLEQVGTWITTHGADGVVIARSDAPTVTVPAVPTDHAADPTGVGDAFRAGFLAGLSRRWPPAQAARLGCALATEALQTVGTQEYRITPADLIRHAADAPVGIR